MYILMYLEVVRKSRCCESDENHTNKILDVWSKI